jgi:asparagine synthase (glutamine-hydrolysing)
VARAFGSAHREFVVRPDGAALLPALAWHLDEPFADSSMIPTYLVARAARAEVTVALTGIGGDEVFGGYPRYLGGLLAERLGGTLQGRVGRRVAAWVERLPETTASRNLAGWAKRFLRGAQLGEAERYIAWISAFDPAGLARLCEPAFLGRAGGAEGPWAAFRERYAALDGRDVRDRMGLLDLGTYLPDDLLMLGDKMSMASGLEVRVPLCDQRLVEFIFALPPAARVGGLRLKALLKEAVADLLPPAILGRRKQGFSIPLGAWLRGPLRPLATALLSPECVAARGYFRPAAVQALLEAHWRGTRNLADQVFALMMLELWHRTFLDAVVPEALVAAAERR